MLMTPDKGQTPTWGVADLSGHVLLGLACDKKKRKIMSYAIPVVSWPASIANIANTYHRLQLCSSLFVYRSALSLEHAAVRRCLFLCSRCEHSNIIHIHAVVPTNVTHYHFLLRSLLPTLSRSPSLVTLVPVVLPDLGPGELHHPSPTLLQSTRC